MERRSSGFTLVSQSCANGCHSHAHMAQPGFRAEIQHKPLINYRSTPFSRYEWRQPFTLTSLAGQERCRRSHSFTAFVLPHHRIATHRICQSWPFLTTHFSPPTDTNTRVGAGVRVPADGHLKNKEGRRACTPWSCGHLRRTCCVR